MADPVVAVVDTNVFLNLATPVVDSRPTAPTGADPLKALLVSYDVHTPTSVIGELSAATRDDDLLSAAAALVLQASDQLTTCEVSDRIDEPLDYPLVARGVATALWFVWNTNSSGGRSPRKALRPHYGSSGTSASAPRLSK